MENESPQYGAAPVPPSVVRPEPESAKIGPVGRLFGTLFSPGETFADINRRPTWVVPMILSMILTVAASWAFTNILKPDWDRLIRDSIKKREEQTGQKVPPEQVDQQIAGTKWFMKYASILTAIGTIIYYFALAGIFALALMLIQAQTTFKKILSVVIWAGTATGLVGAIVMIASLLIKDRESLDAINPMDPGAITATNLAAFLPSDLSPVLLSIAASFDVFTIWLLILLSIGFAAISGSRKIKTGKTATLVFSLWGVWVLIKAGLALIIAG